MLDPGEYACAIHHPTAGRFPGTAEIEAGRDVAVPMMAGESRKIEYQADAGAAEAGLGGGLQRALERISAFEIPKNAWDAALMSTHPPTELRIESLEEGGIQRAEPPGAIAEVSAKRVEQMFGVLAVLVAAAISPHIPIWHNTHGSWWW